MREHINSDSWRYRLIGAGLLVLAGILWLPQATRAQSQEETLPKKGKAAEEPKAGKNEKAQPQEAAPEEPASQSSRKNYVMRNGTITYGRTEETEKKKTADGEIETQRVRAPTYGGDRRVQMEREVRTRNLPDGSIEKEYTLKNPDGANRLVPTEIVREKIRKVGDSTTIERETLRPDYAGHWQPIRKERVNSTGPEASRQNVKEVREQTLSGDWKLVDRQVTTEKSAEGAKESRSVRQLPDASGRLADYEVRQERTSKEGGKETTDVTVQRRDSQETIHPKFFLVEHTKTEQTKAADGRVVGKSTTESDLVAGGASRNVTPGAPRVAIEQVEEETPGPGGASRKTVSVKERGAVDHELRPAHQVVQETDKNGNVRQVFIPAR